MSEFSKLVNVSFDDNTSYTASFTEETLALPFFHFWGPYESGKSLTYSEFMELYPESAPFIDDVSIRNSSMSRGRLLNWVNIKRALSSGMSNVLCYRTGCPNSIVIKKSSSSSNTEASFTDDISDALIWFKYQGIPTYKSLGLPENFEGELRVKVSFPEYNKVSISLVAGKLDDGDAFNTIYSIESFEGSLIPGTFVDGQSTYIDDVLESNSQFLKASAENFKSVYPSGYSPNWEVVVNTFEFPAESELDGYYTEVLNKYLADPDMSQYTLLIPPSNASAVESVCASIASDRKDINVLWGFPTTSNFTSDDIKKRFNDVVGLLQEPKFFSLFLAARELVKAFNMDFILDGTALWAGRIANVATSVRINQMPSARIYGLVNSNLTHTLTFNEVLSLHELGINSIYRSSAGPCIFGIKSCHPRQLSYFGKANISRVTARLIKYIYPEVMNVIHTDVVNDPINRAKFQLAMNNILAEFISQRNIRPESSCDVSDAINTDLTTKGGEILNVNFSIWFKKLVEKVNIRIVATDSSVNVSVS